MLTYKKQDAETTFYFKHQISGGPRATFGGTKLQTGGQHLTSSLLCLRKMSSSLPLLLGQLQMEETGVAGAAAGRGVSVGGRRGVSPALDMHSSLCVLGRPDVKRLLRSSKDNKDQS